MTSSDIAELAYKLDANLPDITGMTTGILDEWFSRFIDGIADQTMRDHLIGRYALDARLSGSKPSAQANWSRTVYVGARATDEGNGPEWAQFEVTPDFIRRVKMLRATCRHRDLSEACIADAPTAWGPHIPWDHMPLYKPRLVVTADAFWFTANPSRRVCTFETLPLSTKWLIESVTESGESLYRRIDAAQVKL